MDDATFSPDQYMRGITQQAEKEEDSDSCGSWERGHNLSVAITTDKGLFEFPYPYSGMNVSEVGFTVRFRAALDFGGKKVDGMWAVTVSGSHLGEVRRQLRKGVRITLYPSLSKPDRPDKAYVTGIVVEPWEADVPD